MAEFECPEQLRYTTEHSWVRSERDSARVGITAYAEDALGDIVSVLLPAVGQRVQAGTVCGEVESTTAVSDLYAPLTGVVTARNEALESSPELVNSDPYGEGWVLDLQPEAPEELDGLLDAAGYRGHVEAAARSPRA